jgi:hypothetical protein
MTRTGAGAMAVVAAGLLLLGGCWNGGNHSYHFGDVSIGQQLIDLQAALDQGAISPAEHERLKGAIVALRSGCEDSDG